MTIMNLEEHGSRKFRKRAEREIATAPRIWQHDAVLSVGGREI